LENLYDIFKRKGYSRRDFLKFSLAISAFLGLSPSLYPKVVRALEKKEKPIIIWLEFQDCAGCTESFIRSTSLLPTEVLLDYISLEYHETLMAPSGLHAEEAREEVIKKYKGKYVLVVEGSPTSADGGVYCTIGGKSSVDILKETAKHAAFVIAVGSCASWGGIPKASPNPTGAVPVYELIKDKPVINIPGCPPIGDVMVATIVHFLALGKLPPLDNLGRPKQFYGETIHDRCYRRAFYNSGQFAESFDDEKARKGYCLYKLGCKGPITRNTCASVRWNGGLSFPIQSGHPCFGCSEPDFWDRGFIYNPISVMEGYSGIGDTLKGIGIGTAVGIGVGVLNKLINKKKEEK